jgi:diguanylate cyclase (GGDEF)-like protein/PAS domain S-box-containing protein
MRTKHAGNQSSLGADKKLRRLAETRYRTLFEHAPIGILIADAESCYLDANANMCRMLGYTHDELVGLHASDIVDQSEILHIGPALNNIKAKSEHSREWQFRRKDGSVFSAQVNATTMPDGNLLGMVQDISDYKSAEEEINFKNTILQTQMETSLDAILVVGENNQILSYNQKFVALWGLSPQMVSAGLDAPVLQSVVAQIENPEAFVARVEYLYEHCDDKSREEILLKDGRIIDRYSAPVTGADGTYYGRIWYFRDITEHKQAEQALRASEERFKTIFLQAPMGIALIDSLDGHICEVNPRFAEITGRSVEELMNIDWLQITHPDDVQPDLDNMALLNAGRINGFQMEKRYLHPDGRVVWINMSIAPLKVDDKTRPRHLCMIQDINERKEAEARIAHLNRVYAMLSGINTLIVRVNDRDELFREACRVAVEEGGFRMAMLCIVDRHTARIVPVSSAGKDKEFLNSIKNLLSSNEDVSKTMVARAISGKKAIVSNDSLNDPQVLFGKIYKESGVCSMVVLPLIVSDEAVGAIALYARETEFFKEDEMKLLSELASDIAFAIDHIDKQERLNYLAYYDVLTGLANRSLFFDRAAQYIHSAISGGHKLAIGLIDLERFKNINDSLGRPAGDSLLKQMAEWLTQFTLDANLLARIDADHFAFVVPEVKTDGNLAKLVENLMATFLEHTFRLNDSLFRIGVKVGIALFPDDGDDVNSLFRNAEAALKKAKAGGDRFLFYTQKMTEAVADKLTLENQLRQAIDNEEFVLHYQPKVNLVSGKITGTEALIRWNDPRTGLVPPAMFIPVLEETGLIFDVGRWALHKAMEDYLRWRDAGLPAVRVAVNVSPLQLRNIKFIDEIRKVTAHDANAAAGLELEITESLIMEDVNHSITSLNAIRATGVTIAIDDFGTGFSSLSYLAKLPIDTLKIDRTFVIEMDNPEGMALVSTIIILAHALKLKVVAEGVETEKQSRQLLSLNCDEMQGYLFSKPLSADNFEARFMGQK